MSAQPEVDEAKRWMVNKFKADVQLIPVFGSGDTAKIYADQAWRQLGFPYILVNYMSGEDVPGLGVNRLMTIATFQVRIVTDVPPDTPIKAAAKRIDYLLQNAVKELSGNYYFSARRTAPVDRKEHDEVKTERYHNLGGLYRLWITSTP